LEKTLASGATVTVTENLAVTRSRGWGCRGGSASRGCGYPEPPPSRLWSEGEGGTRVWVSRSHLLAFGGRSFAPNARRRGSATKKEGRWNRRKTNDSPRTPPRVRVLFGGGEGEHSGQGRGLGARVRVGGKQSSRCSRLGPWARVWAERNMTRWRR
jgi:hypothetical protein